MQPTVSCHVVSVHHFQIQRIGVAGFALLDRNAYGTFARKFQRGLSPIRGVDGIGTFTVAAGLQITSAAVHACLAFNSLHRDFHVGSVDRVVAVPVALEKTSERDGVAVADAVEIGVHVCKVIGMSEGVIVYSRRTDIDLRVVHGRITADVAIVAVGTPMRLHRNAAGAEHLKRQSKAIAAACAELGRIEVGRPGIVVFIRIVPGDDAKAGRREVFFRNGRDCEGMRARFVKYVRLSGA